MSMIRGDQLVNVVRDDIAPARRSSALGIEDNREREAVLQPDIDVLARWRRGITRSLAALRKEDQTFNDLIEGMEGTPIDMRENGRECLNSDPTRQRARQDHSELPDLRGYTPICEASANRSPMLPLDLVSEKPKDDKTNVVYEHE